MCRALLLPLAVLASDAACADDSSRWSLGMQLGQARGQINVDSLESNQAAADPSPMSYDIAATIGGSNRFGWRVFTGYRLTNYLAVHVGYTDLGEAESRLVDTALQFARMPMLERVAVQTVRGVDLGLQLKVPVSDRVSVDVHGGKYFWRSSTRIEGEWGEDVDMRSRRSDADEFFGAGLEVAVINDLSATLSWTHYQVGDDPVALWTVGALYRFGIY
jgi:opacity protein-like surface antigen